MTAAERERILALAEEWEFQAGRSGRGFPTGLRTCADELRALIAEMGDGDGTQ